MGWGSIVGGIIGSIVPGIGTAIGAAIGGGVDYITSDAGTTDYGVAADSPAGVYPGGGDPGVYSASDPSGTSSGNVPTVSVTGKQVGSMIGTGAGLGAASGIGQYLTNEELKELQGRSFDWNAQQAAINRDFQSQQAGRQMDFQRMSIQDLMNFQESSAGRQMAFQERMSSTAYQRATQDMQAAGLNPMLAYSQGGASSPGGAMAQGASASGAAGSGSQASVGGIPNVQNAYGQAIGTGISASKALQEIENMQRVGDRIDAETALLQQQKITSSSSAARMDQDVQNLKQQIEESKKRVDRLVNEAENIKQDTRLKWFVQDYLQPEVFLLTKANRELAQLDMPAARANAKAWETEFGQEARPWLKDLFGAAGAAGGLGLRMRGGQGLTINAGPRK